MHNKNSITPVIYLSFVLLAMASCKKESTSSRSPAELITGNWQTVSQSTSPAVFDVNGDGVKDTDTYTGRSACGNDDFVSFKAGGVVEYNAGNVKCSASEPQIETHSWTISADGKTLTIDIDKATIVQLDEGNLKLSSADTENGTPYTIVTALVKK